MINSIRCFLIRLLGGVPKDRVVFAESKYILREKVYARFIENKNRKFGSLAGWWALPMLTKNGSIEWLPFTNAAITEARERASKNQEDMP
jgi:hypothetical protein